MSEIRQEVTEIVAADFTTYKSRLALDAETEHDIEWLVRRVFSVLEQDAVKRAVAAFVGSSPQLKERCLFDVAFRAALDAVIQITVAGVFGYAPVSEDEYKERARNIRRLIADLPIGDR